MSGWVEYNSSLISFLAYAMQCSEDTVRYILEECASCCEIDRKEQLDTTFPKTNPNTIRFEYEYELRIAKGLVINGRDFSGCYTLPALEWYYKIHDGPKMEVCEYWLDNEKIKHYIPAPIEGIQGERFSTAKAIELMQKGHIVSSDVGQEDYYILVDGELYGYYIDMNLEKVSDEEMARMFTETWYYIK